MAHHSSEQDAKMLENMLQQSDQVKPGNSIADMVKQLELGPTGKFPEGKLAASDEGEIKIAIGVHEGKVVMNFGKSIAWFGMTKEQARAMGTLLIRRSDELE